MHSCTARADLKTAVLLAVALLSGTHLAGTAYGDDSPSDAHGSDHLTDTGKIERHPPPFQQQRDGVFLSAIQCNAPNELYIRDAETPVCITPSAFAWLSGYGMNLAAYDESPASGRIDTIVVGLLAPLTGGAAGYGQDIWAASELAMADFNDLLEDTGQMWRLGMDRRDTMTSFTVQFEELVSLGKGGTSIVVGPSIDIYDHSTIEYANDNNMLLISCCSAVPDYAVANDALFRMTPDQTNHGAAIAEVMHREGIRAVVTAGRDALWITQLLEPAESRFIELGGETVTGPILYDVSGQFDATTIQMLADSVRAHLELYDPEEVAVLFVGFEETFDFIEMASLHDAPGSVRWFGADANTIMHDNEAALVFADSVDFTSVQPTVPDNEISSRVSEMISASLGRTPSVYALFEYDTVQIIGRAILDAQSTSATEVADSILRVAQEYSGASGTPVFNAAGDRANAIYGIWEIEDGAWTRTHTVAVGYDAAE